MLAAEELVITINDVMKIGCADKMQHIKNLKQLTEIMDNKAPPTVANAQTSRLGTVSTSNDNTAPRVVKAICQIHQHRTQANTPIPTITEEFDDTIYPAEVNNKNDIAVPGG